MTELATSPTVPRTTGRSDTEVLADPQLGTTLITEQEVLIASAVALAGPSVRRHPVRDVLRAMFSSNEKSDGPRHYPKRYEFIESALMAREMHRL